MPKKLPNIINNEIQVTSIYYKNLYSDKMVLCNVGSARSSKSYSIAQLLATKFRNERKKKFLIIRKTLPALKLSCLMVMEEQFDKFGLYPYLKWDRNMLNVTYEGNFMHFGSVDDYKKIQSTEWNYIWMEETMEFEYMDYMILKTRLSAPTVKERNQLFMSLNPEDVNHWIKEKVIDIEKDIEVIHSTYRDNPFLTNEYVNILEGLINQDLDFYGIYAEGEWGNKGDKVYTNWDIIDKIPDLPKDIVKVYGLDFGYNVETALVELHIDKKNREIWERQLIYQTGLTSTDLIRKMDEINCDKNIIIFADSARPDSIKEISNGGYKKIKPAQKIHVKDGIDIVKGFRTHITVDSVNIIEEKRRYSWKKDLRTNKPLDEPVKFKDHAQDAERYAVIGGLKVRNVKDTFFKWIK